ncbi:hypothetical protein, partial [Thalassolituus sp.]|uniref:hypothetical protein n=1 Tax=Thalassolituus sp. TaxID=2030822 RepID=UPI003515127D
SGLAQAASEETTSQMMLLPEHYELMNNGGVVFKLETGENLSLTADQYLILEDGLLLITDELAQASIYSLPVMGSVRAQLLSELEQVATIDGTVAEATPAQTLSITEGQAPRLSEQVELQTFELAQASDESSSEGEEALAIGMSVAPGAMALLGMLMTSDQPVADQPVAAPTNSAPVFASGAAATANFLENDTSTVYTATATDADSDALTFAILAGKDAASFSINAGTGALTFVTPPDVENPTDLLAGGVAGDNVYVVDLEVTDGNGGVANQTLSVTVTDVVALNLTGTAGVDVLIGSTEGDFIDGNQGNDYIYAGAGADTVDGGPGVDNIFLGPNDGAADTVRMVGRYGVDRAGIWDFETGLDTIVVDNTASVANGTSPSALVSVAGLNGLAINNIIADTSTNLGVNAVTVGNVSGIFTSGGYAFVTDTGQLLYDADGDFSAGVISAGYIFSSPSGTTPASVVASDFEFGF